MANSAHCEVASEPGRRSSPIFIKVQVHYIFLAQSSFLWTPERAILSVDAQQHHMSDVLNQLSNQVKLLDISIDSQPIEEIIMQLYKEYHI